MQSERAQGNHHTREGRDGRDGQGNQARPHRQQGRYGNQGGRGRGGHGGRSGPREGGDRHDGGNQRKRENILDLGKYMDKSIQVKFLGGREVVGILKGFDQLNNIVLDDTVETLREITEDSIIERTRPMGLVVARGITILLIAPALGNEEIENPFITDE